MNFLFAWRYFKGKKSANAINIIAWVTIGVIAFATACQILVLSVFNGFEGLVRSLYNSFYTDIRVVPAKGKTFVLTPALLKQMQQQPGIRAVSLVIEEKALLQNEGQQAIVSLKGVDDNYANVSGVAGKTVEGKFNTGTADNPAIIVGSGIQNGIGINVDGHSKISQLTVILPKKGLAPISDPMQSLSEGDATASGVFEIQQDLDNQYAITNIGFVKQQIGLAANEYTAAEIKLDSNADMDAVQQQLSKLMGANYNVQTKYQQNTSLYTTMRLEKWFIYAVLTLILVIAAFNMVSALTMLVLEKQKDISILQSMGANKSMILKIFLSEGLLLAAIGAGVGTLLSIIICLIQMKYKLIKLTGGSFLIDYFPVKMQLPDFLLVVSTVSIIAFIAAWFPSRKAARQLIELRGS